MDLFNPCGVGPDKSTPVMQGIPVGNGFRSVNRVPVLLATVDGSSMNDTVSLRPLVPDDAPGLQACFERCYGRSYVAGYFYHPEALRDRIESGRLRSIVAVSGSGEIVGHMGLTLRHAGARTVDAGNTIVDPCFRGKQLVARLGMALSMLCRDQGFFGYHHYPTTIHPIMQKLSVSSGGVETGLMLGYIPAGTEYREIEGAALDRRLAVTVAYQPLNPAPSRKIYLPQGYAPLIGAMARAARLQREFLPEPRSARPPEVSVFDVIDDPRRSLLRLDIRRPGRDLFVEVDRVLDQSPAELIQIDLPLDNAVTPALIPPLRARNFFFGAWLPEYLDGDVLRLQRVPGDLPPRPNLVNPGAGAIFELIDREFNTAVRSRTGRV